MLLAKRHRQFKHICNLLVLYVCGKSRTLFGSEVGQNNNSCATEHPRNRTLQQMQYEHYLNMRYTLCRVVYFTLLLFALEKVTAPIFRTGDYDEKKPLLIIFNFPFLILKLFQLFFFFPLFF